MAEDTTVGASRCLYPQWVEAIQSRSPEAWDELIDAYSQRLQQDIGISLRRWGLPEELAEDIAQEIWLRALRKIHRFVWRGDEKFYHWLRVISSKCIHELQDNRRHTYPLEDFDDTISPADLDDLFACHDLHRGNVEDEVILRERMVALDQALRNLRPEEREIYVRWLMGERPRILAVIYHKKVGTVAQLVQRANRRVEAYMRLSAGAFDEDNNDEG